MARQVLPIVGAVVGAFYGNPQLGFAIGSIIGNAVDPLEVRGPKIGDAGIQTSAEGVFCPIVMGTAAVKGNVITRGNRQIKKKREQQGKGGPVTITERVYWTFAIRICEGPITGITRIWQDEKLVYDVRPESTIQEESAEYANRFRLYLGDESQLPDPDLEAFLGMGNVPSYRGRAYIVFPNFDLTDQQERIPEFRFEVTSDGIASSGEWLFGPVAENGAAGGSELFYRTTNNVKDWSNSTLHAAPAWLSSIQRVSVANGIVFMQGGLTDNVAASFDRGTTWQEGAGPISLDHNVCWNGNRYYCRDQFSIDGLTWSTIPNLSGIPSDLVAVETSGKVYASYDVNDASRFEISSDNGSTWQVKTTTFDQISYLAEHAGRVHFTRPSIAGVNGVPSYSDDELSTIQNSVTEASAYTPYYGGGAWIRKGENQRLFRSVDNGETYDVVLNSQNLGSNISNTVAFGVEVWAIARITSGSPHSWNIGYSTNGAATFSNGSTLYGNGGNLVVVGGGIVVTPDKITLHSVVSTLYTRVGIPASDYDVAELIDELDGVVFAGDYTCADAVRTLMPTYFFDAAEYDDGTGYKLHHVKRGKPVVATIIFDDLIDAPEQSVREDSLERPLMLHLHYESPTIGYAPAKATVMRDSPDVKVVGEISVQVPVAFNDPQEPRQIAHKLHKIAWAEVAGEQDFTLGDNWLELVATDTIGLSLRGQVRRLRINQEMIDPGCQAYKLVADRQSAYTSEITGIPLPPPTPPPPSIVGATIFEFMDLPALNDGNDRLLYYDAATGQTEAWYGAQVQRAIPPDTTFTEANTFTQNTIMGVLLDDIPEASEHYPDSTNVVRVKLYTDDEIEALTEQQFLSEGGSFALEKPDGSWEIMQYRNAIDEGDKTFALSFLNRGALNTGASEHTASARFVLLEGVQSVDAVTAWIGNDLTHRAVSLGTSPDGLPTYTDTYTAKSQTEFPVAHLFAVRNGDTLEISTVPRHRFGTEDNPIRSINWTGYRWVATDGVNITSTDTITADTTIDVTGWSTPIIVTVAQLNRFTGAGPSVQESVS